MMGLSTLLVASVATLACTAEAVPFVDTHASHFTITQTPRSQPIYRSPIVKFANALRKYRDADPFSADAASVAARDLNATVPATPTDYDFEFLSPVTVGNQTLNVDFDTGSADFWVFSSGLEAEQQQHHDIYTPGSDAVKLENHTWKVTYADGSMANGIVYLDNVTVGGMVVERQAVEAAEWVSGQLAKDVHSDGILGLGFSGANKGKFILTLLSIIMIPTKQKTVFENIKEHLAIPVFAANLKHNAPGSYDFGYIDKKKYKGELAYTAVNASKNHWMVTFTGFSVGKVDNSTKITGVVDTGTSFLLVPSDVAKEYYSHVPEALYEFKKGGWNIPCDATLPDFSLEVNGTYKAVIPGHEIIYQPLTPGDSKCFGGIQGTNIELSILGGPLLKSQYTVFDYRGPRIGFAQQTREKRD